MLGRISVDMREDGILVHGLTEELSDVAAITDMGERVARCERKR